MFFLYFFKHYKIHKDLNNNLTEIIDLPKYAYPDLTNKEGYWAASMAENSIKENDIVFFYVDTYGHVHYGINDKYEGIFLSGVEVTLNGSATPLWAIIDVYGNTTAIQLCNFVKKPSEEPSAINNNFSPIDSLSSIGKFKTHTFKEISSSFLNVHTILK